MWPTVAKCCKCAKPNMHMEHRKGLYICCSECSDWCQSCCSCEFGTISWSVHVTVSLDNGYLYGRGIVLECGNALRLVTAHHKFQMFHRKKPSGVTSGEHYHQQT